MRALPISFLSFCQPRPGNRSPTSGTIVVDGAEIGCVVVGVGGGTSTGAGVGSGRVLGAEVSAGTDSFGAGAGTAVGTFGAGAGTAGRADPVDSTVGWDATFGVNSGMTSVDTGGAGAVVLGAVVLGADSVTVVGAESRLPRTFAGPEDPELRPTAATMIAAAANNPETMTRYFGDESKAFASTMLLPSFGLWCRRAGLPGRRNGPW